jgi:hypothetical protein
MHDQDEPLLDSDQIQTSKFFGYYQDSMEMYAAAEQVAEYLNNHSSWFVRCAQPMTAIPLGENGYALVIGKFGAFGYEVEPKIGLELIFADPALYHIRTIPIPDYIAPGYEVDYRATLQLVEENLSEINTVDPSGSQGKMTRIEWELELTVEIRFPKFIYRLPQGLIQSTGDRILNQIVRQVSRRLTKKVQEDFHQLFSIPFSPPSSK